jgi:hypothetical protein
LVGCSCRSKGEINTNLQLCRKVSVGWVSQPLGFSKIPTGSGRSAILD